MVTTSSLFVALFLVDPAKSWTCQAGQGGKSSDDALKVAIKHTKDNSLESCGAACSAESKCIAFDFTTNSGEYACRLFPSTTHRSSSGKDDRQFCTESSDPSDFICREGMGPFGGFTKQTKDNSLSKCEALCTSASNCIAFDYTTQSVKDACRLYDTTEYRPDDGGAQHRQYCSLNGPEPSPPPSPAPTPRPSPTPPTPTPSDFQHSAYRFPYDNQYIIEKSDDGFPDYDMAGDNNAESCPWRSYCSDRRRRAPSPPPPLGVTEVPMLGEPSRDDCRCGTPDGRKSGGCYQCKGYRQGNVTHHLDKSSHWNMEPMKRSAIIERALGWVAWGFCYGHEGYAPETCARNDNVTCPYYSYGTSLWAVCDSLIDMAFRGAPRYTIPCEDLRPGDAIHHPHHIMMFRRWMPGNKFEKNAKFLGYQMGGEWGKANAQVIGIKGYGPQDWTCYRRNNTIEDVPIAVV